MKRTRCLVMVAALTVAAMAGCGGSGRGQFFRPKVQQDQPGQFTILLYVLRGPGHAARIASFKRQTEQDTGWSGLYVVGKPDHSELYWGKYATHKEAAKDLKKAKQYRTPLKVPVYAKALVIPLPGADPGPPEWKLRNANGAYTMVVAVFYDQPEANYIGRKEYAVAYCRQLRQKGEQAYYRHGSARSTVTIGAFGQGAILILDNGGQTKPQIRSQRMLDIRRRYPQVAVNGRQELIWRINPATGKREKWPVESYASHIPGKKGTQQPDALDSLGYPELR